LFGGDEQILKQFKVQATYDPILDGPAGNNNLRRFYRVVPKLDQLCEEVFTHIRNGWNDFISWNDRLVQANQLEDVEIFSNLPTATSNERRRMFESCKKEGGFIIFIRPSTEQGGRASEANPFDNNYLNSLNPPLLVYSNLALSGDTRAKIVKGMEKIVACAEYYLPRIEPLGSLLKRLPDGAPFDFERPALTVQDITYLEQRKSLENFMELYDEVRYLLLMIDKRSLIIAYFVI
jgi:hypothetical protein